MTNTYESIIEDKLKPPYGDRQQELVFIVTNL